MFMPRCTPSAIFSGVPPALSADSNVAPDALLGKEAHDRRHVLVGGTVHGCLAVSCRRVQIVAERQRHLDASSTSGSVSRILSWALVPRGRHHQWRRVVVIRSRIGAELGEQPHQIGVGGSGREQDGVAPIEFSVVTPFSASSSREHSASLPSSPLSDELETVHVAGPFGSRGCCCPQCRPYAPTTPDAGPCIPEALHWDPPLDRATTRPARSARCRRPGGMR